MKESTTELNTSEEIFIQEAAQFLENPGLLIRLANKAGVPLESLIRRLPEKYSKVVSDSTNKALQKGLQLMLKTVPHKTESPFFAANKASQLSGLKHSLMAAGTGAVGGFVGIASLPIELPISTGIILRSILDAAKEFHMDVRDPEVQMECLYVLTLGSTKTIQDDQLDSAYLTSRIGFAQLIRQAAQGTGPAASRLITAVARRFEVVVSEKVLAEALPLIGAIGGAAINLAFTNYFSEAARFHFGLRSLEKKYGQGIIQEMFIHSLRRPPSNQP
jgi:hypothetical protein